jgi:pentatricopeptide repeat protein
MVLQSSSSRKATAVAKARRKRRLPKSFTSSPRPRKETTIQQKKQQPSKQGQQSGSRVKLEETWESRNNPLIRKTKGRIINAVAEGQNREETPILVSVTNILEESQAIIATLALSAPDLSRQKRLDEARAVLGRHKGHESSDEEMSTMRVLSWTLAPAGCRGRERIVQDLRRLDKINVTTQTALLKGYAHSGRMQQAINVFRAMCSESEAWDR